MSQREAVVYLLAIREAMRTPWRRLALDYGVPLGSLLWLTLRACRPIMRRAGFAVDGSEVA